LEAASGTIDKGSSSETSASKELMIVFYGLGGLLLILGIVLLVLGNTLIGVVLIVLSFFSGGWGFYGGRRR
jgi:hypothetical protein